MVARRVRRRAATKPLPGYSIRRIAGWTSQRVMHPFAPFALLSHGPLRAPRSHAMNRAAAFLAVALALAPQIVRAQQPMRSQSAFRRFFHLGPSKKEVR